MAGIDVPASGDIAAPKPFYRILYVQVLAGIVIGGLLGALSPDIGVRMGPFGTLFVKLIAMIIAPVIFCTVVSGIAGIEGARKVGRVGGKAILYFEVVSTFALALGLLVGNVLRPGAGFPVPAAAPAGAANADLAKYIAAGKETHFNGGWDIFDYFLHFFGEVIPKTVVGAFSDGNILQVLLFSVLFGFALLGLGRRGAAVRGFIDESTHVIFAIVNAIMQLAPLGAFGAMAFTIGKYGPQALGNLLALIATFYITAALFVFGVLGAIAWRSGFNIFKFVAYIKDELLIVLGTSSSESALAPLMKKLENMGCSKPVVGLVVPAGYSFNLDGTNIYMTLASLFLAQAYGMELSWDKQALLLGVAMLTSKGASGITGAGFIVLASTLEAVAPQLTPGLALIYGIDKFMSECRALTNIIGNGVATVVVSGWEGELDRDRMQAVLSRQAARVPLVLAAGVAD